MRHKKGDGAILFIAVVAALIILVAYFSSSRGECRSNNDCDSESYCGSDLMCHKYPTIQKTVIEYNLLWPSVIIGLAIIIAAMLFNLDKLGLRRGKEHMQGSHHESRQPHEGSYKHADERQQYYESETKGH